LTIKFETLKKNTEFKKVFDTNRSRANSLFVLFILKSGTYKKRFGITTAKKIGSSVKRNLLKRRVREILRSMLDKIEDGYDFVIIIRVRAKDAEFKQLKMKLIDLFKKAKMLKG
jgi:ribonuclease P protein component